MIIKLIFLFLMNYGIMFLLLQVLNIFYISESIIDALLNAPYFNLDLFWLDNITKSMFILGTVAMVILSFILLADNVRSFKIKSKYERHNYNSFLTRRQVKRGLVRVCYNSKGEVTRFRLECLWDILWYPIASLQNKIANHFQWKKTKRWNVMRKWKSFDGEIKHRSGIPVLAYRKYYLFGKFNKVYYLPSETHTFFVGSTRRGKSVTFMLPMMISSIHAGVSMVVHDTKKELCESTYELLKEHGYDIVILDFDTPSKGDCWSPIKLAWDLWREILEEKKKENPAATYRDCNMSKPIEIVADLALNLCYEADAKQPMWWQASADMIAGGIIFLFEEGREENINILSLQALFTDKELLKKYILKTRKPSDQSVLKIQTFLDFQENALASLKGVFNNKLRSLLLNEDIINMTSSSEAIDMRKMFNRKTAIFLMSQSSKSTFYPLVTAFITQFYEVAIMVAKNSPGRKLKIPFEVYLDELPVLPQFKELQNMYSVGGGHGITLIAFIQAIAQLVEKYGEKITDIFVDNNASTVFLGASSDETKDYFAKQAGKELYYNKRTKVYEERSLITTERLNSFEKGRSILFRNEWRPYIMKLPPFDWYTFGRRKRTTDFEKCTQYHPCEVIDLKSMISTQLHRDMTNAGGRKFRGKSDLSKLNGES